MNFLFVWRARDLLCRTAKADVWKWNCRDKLSFSCQCLLTESVLIYCSKFFYFDPCVSYSWLSRGEALLKHTADRLISCSRRSLLPLFAQEGIMNDSEWWNGRSLQSSDFNIEGPARTNFRLGNEMDVNKDRGWGGPLQILPDQPMHILTLWIQDLFWGDY